MPCSLLAQETMVVGQVLNSADKRPIPQVNIYFKNTDKVVQSNDEGYFLIKTVGKQTTLVFSCVGFKRQEINIKPGQSVGIDIQLEEKNTLLQEVFIIPGANPALELMRNVRMMRKINDASEQNGFSTQCTEQELILLSKVHQRNLSWRIFNQLKIGNISTSDSSLVVPLYMAESTFSITRKERKELSKNIFSSPESGMKILEKLLGSMETELNFYQNSVRIFGKDMVSPLANTGYAYYDYYLADSTHSHQGTQYEIHYRSKNAKNLAFNGKLWIDSASFALTGIEAELPNQSNINYIHNLRISERFAQQRNKRWMRQSEEMALNMHYALLADSLHPKPEIFVKRTAVYQYVDSMSTPSGNFANSDYRTETLDEKLKDLNNTPILRTANWIADAMFTGYMDLGKVDVGKISQLMRITDMEGLRLTLPFRTNEKLWKNISLGGYVGYGFANRTAKYSGVAQYKLHGKKRRILGVNYTNDYRRVDYNYNDFLFRENPLITGDEDIASSVFAFKSAGKMAERHELSFSYSTEWTRDIESSLYLRSNRFFANVSMPMQLNGLHIASSLLQQSVTVATRFSFDERKYDDHTQRIYIANTKPVIYAIFEAGQYKVGHQYGTYTKISASVRQFYTIDIGRLHYVLDAGVILGNVPYQLLAVPPGNETGGYSTFRFNMMNYMEYAADNYMNLHTELMLNGLIMNWIPFIKNFNLREMCSFHVAYGSLNKAHTTQLDYPTYMNPLNKPYAEVGVGLTNILSIFIVQSVWRLTDLNHPRVAPWGLRGCLRLNF